MLLLLLLLRRNLNRLDTLSEPLSHPVEVSFRTESFRSVLSSLSRVFSHRAAGLPSARDAVPLPKCECPKMKSGVTGVVLKWLARVQTRHMDQVRASRATLRKRKPRTLDAWVEEYTTTTKPRSARARKVGRHVSVLVRVAVHVGVKNAWHESCECYWRSPSCSELRTGRCADNECSHIGTSRGLRTRGVTRQALVSLLSHL